MLMPLFYIYDPKHDKNPNERFQIRQICYTLWGRSSRDIIWCLKCNRECPRKQELSDNWFHGFCYCGEECSIHLFGNDWCE